MALVLSVDVRPDIGANLRFIIGTCTAPGRVLKRLVTLVNFGEFGGQSRQSINGYQLGGVGLYSREDRPGRMHHDALGTDTENTSYRAVREAPLGIAVRPSQPVRVGLQMRIGLSCYVYHFHLWRPLHSPSVAKDVVRKR
jgi:hypothetical protein